MRGQREVWRCRASSLCNLSCLTCLPSNRCLSLCLAASTKEQTRSLISNYLVVSTEEQTRSLINNYCIHGNNWQHSNSIAVQFPQIGFSKKGN